MDDITAFWPDDRESVAVGRLELTRPITPSSVIGDPVKMHDTSQVTDGIEVSPDDQILAARYELRGAYTREEPLAVRARPGGTGSNPRSLKTTRGHDHAPFHAPFRAWHSTSLRSRYAPLVGSGVGRR